MAAYNARDLAAFESVWTDETVWAPSITGGDTVTGGEYIGLDGMRRYFAELDEVWTSFTVTPLAFETMRPGRTLLHHRITGEGRLSGATVELENWGAAVTEGDRIQSMRVFATREEALASLERG